MNRFFSLAPLYQSAGLFLIRILVGSFMIYPGWDLFDSVKMKKYTTWDTFKVSAFGSSLPYLGKAAGLLGGMLLLNQIYEALENL